MRLLRLPSGSLLAALFLLASASFIACDDSGETPNPIPRIFEFSSSEKAVSRGRPVTLSWVVDADRVTITRLPDTMVVESTDQEGAHRTEPITKNTTFVLTVYRGDRSASERLSVTFLGSQADVAILSFDASTQVVSPGDDVILTWRTVNASGASVNVGETPVASGIELPNGMTTVNPTETTEYTLVAQGEGGPVEMSVLVNVRRPEILLFEASPVRIPVGGSVTLSWSVSLASTITIEEMGGATVFTGADPSGTVSVDPTSDTTYVLTASDDAGLSATASVDVDVDRPVQAVIVAFDATPSTANIGDPITLAWQVENASGGVEVSSPIGTLATSTAATGSTVVRVGEDTTFRLRALSAGGDAESTAAVTIQPSPPYALSFSATPNPVARGADVALSWSTLGADSVVVRQGGNVLATTTDAAGSVAYSTSVATPATTPFSLVLSNANGTATATVTLDAVDAPEIVDFSSDAGSFTGSATITLSWNTTNATSVALTRSGIPVPAFPGTPNGTFQAFVAQTTLFELRASNAATTVSEILFIAETTGEVEPNDSAVTAVQTITAGGRVDGQIASPTDEDWYAIAVPGGGSILAETTDGSGSCALDTVIEIYERQPNMAPVLLVSDDDSGSASCSKIDPAIVAEAKDLPAGSREYFVVVKSNGGVGPYSLTVAPRPAACGNGIREISNGEQCDDLTASCSGTCLRVFTPAGTLTGPGSNTFSGAISIPTEVDLYQLNIPAAGSLLTARTYTAAAPNCQDDTLLELFDRNFVLVASNDQSGADNCSSLHPSVDMGLDLIGGRAYYLAVTETGQDSVIPAYQVAIDLLAKDECGNGVVEGMEACDDGNTAAGDGCSATCTFPGVDETEANDTSAQADAMIMTQFARGTLSDASDEDWYSYTIPAANAGDSLRIQVRGPYGACLAERGAADTTVELWADDGMNLVQVASDTDSGADGRCSDIDPVAELGAATLPSATYFMRVAGDGGSTGDYLLDVSLVAPSCGNGIVDGTEFCDDGGTATGDGCGATCQFELAGTSSISPATFSGGIGVGEFAAYRIDGVSANGGIQVATGPVGGGACTLETGIQLYDSTGNPVGPFYQGGAANSTCSEIAAFDPGASGLAAGNYFVTVWNLGSAQAGVETTITLY